MPATPVSGSTHLDDAAVDALLARARREVEEGLLPSCQLALGLDGDVVVHEAFGAATTRTRYVVFSCTKALVAATVWTLLDEGLLRVDDRVVDHVPEFGTNGKDVVTVDHLLLHTAGFPQAPLGPPRWWTREGRLEAFGRWRLDWEPGTRFEYHPTSAHWVLAELIERVTDTDYRDVVEARITRPAGLARRVLGVAPEDQDDVAPLVTVGEPATPEELRAAFGVAELPATEVTPDALLAFDQPEVRALGVPGGGAVMTAADLARLYQVLLHDPGGIWSPEVRSDGTGQVRNTFPDPVSGVAANRTRGLVVAGDDGSAHLRANFGRRVSPRAFGHSGAGGQIAWADPATGLSFAYCTNGLDQHAVREPRRGVALSSLAAVCARIPPGA